MSEPRLDPAEQEVERTLARLDPPAPRGVSAASVMVEVHRRRQRFQLWTWRYVAAGLALALAVQFSVHRRQVTPADLPQPDRIVTLTHVAGHTALPPVILPVTGDGYISTRNRLIAFETPPARPPASESLPPPRLFEHAPATHDRTPPSLLELLFANPEPVQS